MLKNEVNKKILVELNAVGSRKKDLVRKTICSGIISGVYRKGKKIPSCRMIAEQLQVSKNSAYNAYSDLVN